MKRTDTRHMLEEHFRHYEEINNRKDRTEKLWKFGLIRITNKRDIDKYGNVDLWYCVNLYNPIVWVASILGIFVSMFLGGMVAYFQELPGFLTTKRRIEISKRIYEKYADLA